MRFKEFIIFIIIFTIIYFTSFILYDKYKNKKDIENTENNNFLSIDLNKYHKYASFFGINSLINIESLREIYLMLKNNIVIKISELSLKYNITDEELITIIEYFEYIGILKRKSIHKKEDIIKNVDDKEDALIVKYSILFSNKYDYNTILRNGGFGSEKEINQIIEYHLIPGIKIQDKIIYYVGDLDE